MKNNEAKDTQLDNATLLEIIKAQSDIAKLGLDLGGVMAYVAERTARSTDWRRRS